MSKAKRTALVRGAGGLAGGYMLRNLREQGGWDIVAVSRRKPRIPGDYRHIAADLLDPADCRAKLGPLTNISHLFYLAITERPDPGETISANANMFFNLVKRSRLLHPCSSMSISLRAPDGTEITSVPTRLRPGKTIRGICRRISITTSRTFSKNSREESAGRGRSGVRTRSADSPREDR